MTSYLLKKVINNNVVLASETDTGDQVILMSKGIGFGRKIGTRFVPGHDNQVYKLWSDHTKIQNISYDEEKLNGIIRDLCRSVSRQFHIPAEKLYQTLLDHIVFAIDRMRFGLDLEYPFFGEVSILYAQEYELARHTVHRIHEELKVMLNDSEAGYIAIHIYSEREHRPVHIAIDSLQMYSKITSILTGYVSKPNILLLIIQDMITKARDGIHTRLPAQCHFDFSESRRIAQDIAACAKEDIAVMLTEDDIAFLAVAVERARQQD